MLDRQAPIPFAAVTLREMNEDDDRQVEILIRNVSSEFGCIGPGYSSSDPELSQMHQTYSVDRSKFYVLEFEGSICGCGGIAQLAGGDHKTCELRKMYFNKQLRGIGWGRKLLFTCLRKAKMLGYEHCYLETIELMESANRLYQNAGFKQLTSALGATGHSGSDRWYLMDLKLLDVDDADSSFRRI